MDEISAEAEPCAPRRSKFRSIPIAVGRALKVWWQDFLAELSAPRGWQLLAKITGSVLVMAGLLTGLMTYHANHTKTVIETAEKSYYQLISDLGSPTARVRLGALRRVPSVMFITAPNPDEGGLFSVIHSAFSGPVQTHPYHADLQKTINYYFVGLRLDGITPPLQEVKTVIELLKCLGPTGWYSGIRPSPCVSSNLEKDTGALSWVWNPPSYASDASNPRALFAGVNLQHINLANHVLERAFLHGSDLSNANLSGAQLKGADLDAANLGEATLDGANLQYAQIEDGATLASAKLEGAHLEFSHLKTSYNPNAYAVGAYFSNSDCLGAIFFRSWFMRAHFEYANFQDAQVEGSDFSSATLTNADFSFAKARGAVFLNADLTGASLRRADLATANFDGATLITVDLAGANLDRTRLDRTDLRNSNLGDARNLTSVASFESANIANATGLDSRTLAFLMARGAVSFESNEEWDEYKRSGYPLKRWATFRRAHTR